MASLGGGPPRVSPYDTILLRETITPLICDEDFIWSPPSFKPKTHSISGEKFFFGLHLLLDIVFINGVAS